VTRLFALAGVDYGQWKAVSRTLLRSDFRVPLAQSAEMYSLASAFDWLKLIAVYGLFGATAALVVVLNRDVLLTGTIALTYVTFVLTTAVLTQHGATLLSSSDLAILGPRPVSSRTFVAIRVTNVLFHAFVLTTLVGYPAVIAFTTAHGFSLRRGGAAAVALYGYSTTVTLAFVAAYGVLLRSAGAARLQRAIAYVQLGVGVLAYFGFFLVMQWLGRDTLADAAMPRSGWLLLVPPAWFASYLEIATGIGTPGSWLRAMLSIAALAGFAALLGGRVSAGYLERLAEPPVSVDTAAAEAGRIRQTIFARDEARAVAILVLSHFKHDLRVRMGVLGIVPMVFIYLFIGARELGGADPFVSSGEGRAVDFVSFAVLIFPAILTQQFGTSDAFRASWIYHVTPARAAALVIALKRVAVAYFLAPFVLLLGGLFAWRFGHVGHGLAHAAMLGLVGYFTLQCAVAATPRLPFSVPPEKLQGSARLFVWLFVVLFGGQGLLFFLQRWAYVTWLRTGAMVVILMAASWAMERVIRRRASLNPN
jgi:hypothetical protein